MFLKEVPEQGAVSSLHSSCITEFMIFQYIASFLY